MYVLIVCFPTIASLFAVFLCFYRQSSMNSPWDNCYRLTLKLTRPLVWERKTKNINVLDLVLFPPEVSVQFTGTGGYNYSYYTNYLFLFQVITIVFGSRKYTVIQHCWIRSEGMCKSVPILVVNNNGQNYNSVRKYQSYLIFILGLVSKKLFHRWGPSGPALKENVHFLRIGAHEYFFKMLELLPWIWKLLFFFGQKKSENVENRKNFKVCFVMRRCG